MPAGASRWRSGVVDDAGLALKVPKTLAPGAYKLEATFRPRGEKALTKALPLAVVT